MSWRRVLALPVSCQRLQLLRPKERSSPPIQAPKWLSSACSCKRGTVIDNTYERALYHVIGHETAVRYGVAVGKACLLIGPALPRWAARWSGQPGHRPSK